MKRVEFAPAARADLLSIGLYIAEDNPARATTFVAEIEDKATTIGERPASYPVREDVAPGLRSALHGRYLIFFRDLPHAVRIIRILYGARDLATLAGSLVEDDTTA